MMSKVYFLLVTFLLFSVYSHSQESQTETKQESTLVKNYFETALIELENMLQGKEPLNFKKAVYLSENPYLESYINYAGFCRYIEDLKELCLAVEKNTTLIYNKGDKAEILKNSSIFRVMTDTIFINDTHYLLPFEYDFNDFAGKQDWTNMFVTKLLATRKGNCHSLPYLYKILAEEIGAKAWLSLAPNHIYIKCRSEQTGWYNTELTSRMFPVDAWLMASGYINKQTLISGIYMDTLSLEQSIALCVVDLGKGFERKLPDNDGKFVIECADLALAHYPNCVNAMLLKAEAKTKQYQNTRNQAEKDNLMREMNQLYTQIYETGYREMPEWMYLEWLFSLPNEQSKYQNRTLEKDKR